jgi:hypothetical protein
MIASARTAAAASARGPGWWSARRERAVVLTSARALASQSNHLKREVEKFLGTVRAA